MRKVSALVRAPSANFFSGAAKGQKSIKVQFVTMIISASACLRTKAICSTLEHFFGTWTVLSYKGFAQNPRSVWIGGLNPKSDGQDK